MRKIIINAMALIGIFCIIGAAGNSDYYTGIKEYHPIMNSVRLILIGFGLLIPWGITHMD